MAPPRGSLTHNTRHITPRQSRGLRIPREPVQVPWFAATITASRQPRARGSGSFDSLEIGRGFCTEISNENQRKDSKEARKPGAKTMEHQDLTEKIIGAAIEVHRRLGPGFLESIYEKALVLELQKRGLRVDPQVQVPIFYDDILIGCHVLDLIVENTIVVELKSIKNIEDVHFAIARSYLRASNKEHGLLLNFSKVTLEVKRVIAS
jgi:GxxExxY protein